VLGQGELPKEKKRGSDLKDQNRLFVFSWFIHE